jgi:acetyl esterase/lipase
MTSSFPLWPDGAPGALGNQPKDIPTLTVFLPDATNACAAMIVCAGGAYGHLADHEGSLYAKWLNAHGIAAFVLKYRLGPQYHHPAMLQDATRALRTVRARASEWNIDPKRIGIIGSSAGGHLASTLLTHFDAGNTNAADPIERVSSRPNLGVLCYPVITMNEPFVHRGSKLNLLGTNPPPELVQELSSELHVTTNTPPCFIWATFEDKTVPVENSLQFAEALRKAGVPFDLHIYQKGGHGLGLGSHDYVPAKFLPWTADCLFWLKLQGFMK